MGRLKFRVHVVSQPVFATAQAEANAQNSKASDILGPQDLELRLRLTAEGSDTIEEFTGAAKRQYESVNGVISAATGLYDDLFYYLSPQESMDSLTQSNDICYLLVKDIKKANSGKKRTLDTNGATTNTPKPSTDLAVQSVSSAKKQKTKGGASPSKVDKKLPEKGNSVPGSQIEQAVSTSSSQSVGGKVSDRSPNKQASKGAKVPKSDKPSQSKEVLDTASTASPAPKSTATKSTKASQLSAQHNAQQKGKVSAREIPEPSSIAMSTTPLSSVQNGSPGKEVEPNSGSGTLSKTSSKAKQVEPQSRAEAAASTSETQPNAAHTSFNLLQQTVSSQESASAAVESNPSGAVAKVPLPVEPLSPEKQTQTRSDQDLSEEILDDEGESDDEEEQEEARRADRVRRAKALSATRVSSNTSAIPPARTIDNKSPAAQTSASKNSSASMNAKPKAASKNSSDLTVEKSSKAAPKSRTSNQKTLQDLKQPGLSLQEEKQRATFVESGLSGFEALAKVRPTVHDNEKRPDRYQVLDDTQSSDEESESSGSGSDEDEGDSDASSDEEANKSPQVNPKRKRGGALSALRK